MSREEGANTRMEDMKVALYNLSIYKSLQLAFIYKLVLEE